MPKLIDVPDIFSKYEKIIDDTEVLAYKGRVKEVRGLIIESTGPDVRLNELCFIELPDKGDIPAEVVGFSGGNVYLMPYGTLEGIYPGCYVRGTGKILKIPVGDELKGRILDGKGDPIDGRGKITGEKEYYIDRNAPESLERELITEPLSVGIRAIDGLLTIGKGQRIGIFAGSGVGKSTLLSMMAKNTEADITVVSFVGERGREVKDFIEKNLGEEGLKKTVIVAATSDQPPIMRLRASFVATTIAEYFRDKGLDVLLLMDSVTRLAWAQREIGLSVGEPPTTRGFTPSVFSMLPRLLERPGKTKSGTITAFYTVLVEADDINEPISDTVRGILDGHIVLSRDLAERNHYPAIDILASISRLMGDVITEEHKSYAKLFRNLYNLYKSSEDIINLGAYVRGSNPELDRAIELYPKMQDFLIQDVNEKSTFQETIERLKGIFHQEEQQLAERPRRLF